MSLTLEERGHDNQKGNGLLDYSASVTGDGDATMPKFYMSFPMVQRSSLWLCLFTEDCVPFPLQENPVFPIAVKQLRHHERC